MVADLRAENDRLRRELAEARRKALVDRVDFVEGKLDEVVAANGAHLEYLGKNRWYLSFIHAGGTETAIWFGSKDLRDPIWESREPRALAAKEKGE